MPLWRIIWVTTKTLFSNSCEVLCIAHPIDILLSIITVNVINHYLDAGHFQGHLQAAFGDCCCRRTITGMQSRRLAKLWEWLPWVNLLLRMVDRCNIGWPSSRSPIYVIFPLTDNSGFHRKLCCNTETLVVCIICKKKFLKRIFHDLQKNVELVYSPLIYPTIRVWVEKNIIPKSEKRTT